MRALRLIIGAILGGIAGALLGAAITVGYVYIQTHKPADPRNPGGGAMSPLMAVVAAPACALAGASTGVKIAGRWHDRRNSPPPYEGPLN